MSQGQPGDTYNFGNNPSSGSPSDRSSLTPTSDRDDTSEPYEYLTDEAVAAFESYPALAMAANELLGDYQWYLTNHHTFKHCGRKKTGLSEETAKNHRWSLDRIFRYYWETAELKVVLTPDDADHITDALRLNDLTQLSGENYSQSHKRKLQDALKNYFAWRSEVYNERLWEPEHEFKSGANNPADHLTSDELKRLRTATWNNRNGPSYKHVSRTERRRFKELLARELDEPVENVGPSDWEVLKVSWELPALICTSADAGLRPTDVRRLRIRDLRLEKCTIYIPEEEDTYKRGHDRWEVSIKEETAELLQWWLEERRCYDHYQETDLVFVNERGNPLKSGPLNRRLRNVLDEANIDTANRKLVWTSLRHTIGTLMIEVASLKEVQKQLRHRSIRTSLKYVASSTDRRRKALDEMMDG